MNVMILIGQRKCEYPGQHEPEVLGVITKQDHLKSSDTVASQKRAWMESGEFESVGVVTASVSQTALCEALTPSADDIIKESSESDSGPTIPCTIAEFNQAFVEFNRAIGFKNNSQESIANMYKGLVLHYFGIQDASQEEIDRAATVLEMATKGALRRGWDLNEPDLSGSPI